MKPLVRNIFLLFGVVAIIVMLRTFEVDLCALRHDLPRVLSYLPLIVGVWVFVYACNAGAFQLIVNSGGHDKHLSYRHAYKLTVSGFAFSYITPFGFGGGPYRVMELAGHIGTAHAMSAVVLYSMTHILSHFCLWASSAILFLAVYPDKMNPFLWTVFGIFSAVLVFVLYFFYVGYRNGLIVRLYKIFLFIPYVKKYARRFYDRNMETMGQIDENIACLHRRPRAFYGSLLLEYVARLINSLEFFFILFALGVPVTYSDAVLVLAFSSLMGNVFFFFPMQMGAREGGIVLIVKMLGYANAGGVGVLASILTRIRELVWVFVGVTLVKLWTKKLMK